MQDIIIVGAGPAGSAFASLIDKKYKVLILDARSVLYSDIEHTLKSVLDEDLLCGKCCGGMLAPNTQKVLASLGWSLPRDILVSPQVYALKVLDTEKKMERLYMRNYVNINRKKFDKWLIDKAIANGSEVYQNAFYISSEKIGDIIRVKYRKGGKEYIEETKILIGADGAYSAVRKEYFGNVPRPKEYPAIQEWYKKEKQVPYYYGIADKEVNDYYSWVIPKEDYIIVGSALDDKKNANRKFEILKERLRDYGFSLDKEHFIKKEGSLIFRPSSMRQIALVKQNVALIGESAGIISPSSSEGISYALRCGILLAEAINKDGLDGLKEYKKKAKKIAFSCILKKYRSPFLYNIALSRRLVMKLGVMSVKEINKK